MRVHEERAGARREHLGTSVSGRWTRSGAWWREAGRPQWTTSAVTFAGPRRSLSCPSHGPTNKNARPPSFPLIPVGLVNHPPKPPGPSAAFLLAGQGVTV